MDEVWRETFFADGAWRQKDPAGSQRQQAWFMHVAQGGNIRAMDTEIALTKRMAHLIFAVPDVESVSMGLRWAQFLGMGGSRNLVLAVVRSRLRDFMEDEPFWATVVLFLANQPNARSHLRRPNRRLYLQPEVCAPADARARRESRRRTAAATPFHHEGPHY